MSDELSHKGPAARVLPEEPNPVEEPTAPQGDAEHADQSMQQTKFVLYLAEVLKDYPTDKLEELVKELGRKFEIYGHEDLIRLTDAQIDQIETLKTVQKRKFKSHVKKLQTDAEMPDGAGSVEANRLSHNEAPSAGGMAVPENAVRPRVEPQIRAPDKIRPAAPSNRDFPKSEVKSVEEDTGVKGDRFKKFLGNGIFIDDSKPLRKGCKVYEGEKRYGKGLKPVPVAVKILDIIDSSGEDDWPKKYQREINNMNRLQHNYVAQFVECGEMPNNTPKALYIATILCHPKTLGDIDISALQSWERQSIFIQIGHGLDYIHGEEIAHRDLKPSNILFSPDGRRAIVADFGVSRNVDIDRENATISSSAKYHGTLGWTAAEGEGDKVPDEFYKVDIFAFGLVGHYIFCDKIHPFSNDGKPNTPAVQLANNIMEKSSPNFSVLANLDDGVIAMDLFGKMLSHEPEDRPNIEDVLRHCMFWSPIKKVNFLREMHQHIVRKKLMESGSEEQQLACELVRVMAASSEGALDMDSADPDNSDIVFQVTTEREKRQLKIFSKITEIATEYWKDKLKENPDIKTDGLEDSSYTNRLSQLVRFIRNYSVHKTDPHDKRPCESTWKQFSPLFPKLLPYLIKIMELAFNEEDKELTMRKAAPTAMDIKKILDKKNEESPSNRDCSKN